MLEELSTAQKVVGVKQSLRALREGRARKVFLACELSPRLAIFQKGELLNAYF